MAWPAGLQVLLVLLACMLSSVNGEPCVQGTNCLLPKCFCPTLKHPSLPLLDIPQIVYFGFDDAVQPQVSGYYDQLFTKDRKNPNGCPITMSLFVSDTYTVYSKVNEYYEDGMEIGSHSVTHTDIDTEDKLKREAREQRDNIINKGGIPPQDVVGWRSPNLKTAGDAQPRVLASLNYTYDISLPYSHDASFPWPFTLDFGYPYPCSIPPCPGPDSKHAGFWEVMVRSFTNPTTGLPCGYVDGCRPNGQAAAEEYLWYNFRKTYEGQRAPFGLNMHAAWFATPEYLVATENFIKCLLDLDDVYIVNVKQMLDWMRTPTPLSQIRNFKPWGCPGRQVPSTLFQYPIRVPTHPSRQPIGIIRNEETKQPSTGVKAPIMGKDNLPYMLNVRQPNNTFIPINQPINYRPQVFNRLTTSKPTHTVTRAPRYPPRIDLTFASQYDNAGQGETCVQGVNCKLPACFCRTTRPPYNLPFATTPQIIYLAIDTHVDRQTISPLMQVFSGYRKNPNGCPISGTIFTPTAGNYPLYIQVLQAKGVQFGIKSGSFFTFFTDALQKRAVVSEISRAKSANLTYSSGWRGFASFSPTDTVFQALHENRVKFDSSVMSSNTDMPWPYTLDFGLKDHCSVLASHCPRARYPGMWEVPMIPLQLMNHAQSCFFLDTCPGLIPTEEAVSRILLDNFQLHYKGWKSPFGINLHREWLVGPNSRAFQRGLLRFIDEVLGKGDVVVVSVEQMLAWMAAPVKQAFNFPC